MAAEGNRRAEDMLRHHRLKSTVKLLIEMPAVIPAPGRSTPFEIRQKHRKRS